MFFLSVFGFTDFYDNCPTCPAAGATITISSPNYNNDYAAGGRFYCIYGLTVPTGHQIEVTLAAEANVNSDDGLQVSIYIAGNWYLLLRIPRSHQLSSREDPAPGVSDSPSAPAPISKETTRGLPFQLLLTLPPVFTLSIISALCSLSVYRHCEYSSETRTSHV